LFTNKEFLLMVYLRRALLVLLFFVCIWAVFAQDNTPDPAQIYRFIHFSSSERAGDVRWIEIWERRDAARGDREWLMVDSGGTLAGVESTCYYALAIGGGTPLYMKDGELQPVGTAQELFDTIENRRLADNSQFFATSLDCAAQGTATINGIAAEQCTFENEDAGGVFLIKPPATAQGELWRAVEGRYPVSYQFSADGSNGSVDHRYEFVPPPANFEIRQPVQSEMMCFESGLPYPDDATPLTGNLTYAAYESPLSQAELERFYDLELVPDWEIGAASPNGGRIYRQALAEGNQCTLQLRFSAGRNNSTIVAASVFAETPNIALPEVLNSPIVVQSMYSLPVIPFTGTVSEAAAIFTGDYQAQGWTLREDLTDIRTGDDIPVEAHSAFIVLAQDDQETYITIDALDATNSNVFIQTRAGLCATPFEMP
jgi:hypothetical protein